jgi:hypothetical protein
MNVSLGYMGVPWRHIHNRSDRCQGLPGPGYRLGAAARPNGSLGSVASPLPPGVAAGKGRCSLGRAALPRPPLSPWRGAAGQGEAVSWDSRAGGNARGVRGGAGSVIRKPGPGGSPGREVAGREAARAPGCVVVAVRGPGPACGPTDANGVEPQQPPGRAGQRPWGPPGYAPGGLLAPAGQSDQQGGGERQSPDDDRHDGQQNDVHVHSPSAGRSIVRGRLLALPSIRCFR